MIHVAFDTSALRAEQLRQRNMLILKRLIRQGELRIHLSEVVLRELRSQQQTSAKDYLRTARKNVDALAKILGISEICMQEIDIASTERKLAELVEGVDELTARALDDWIDSWCVVIDQVSPEDGVAVLDDYFAGEGAFRQPKARKDFPDSFIEKSVFRLQAKHGEITALVQDGLLSRALDRRDGVTVYNSVQDFLSSNEIKELVEHDTELSPLGRQIVAWLDEGAFSQILKSFLEREEESSYVYLEAGEIDGTEALGIDIWNGSSEGFSTPIDDLKVWDAVVLTEQKFSVQFSFTARSTLMYCIDFKNWEDLEYNSGVTFRSMSGDGIVEVYDDRTTMKFYGDVEVTLKDGLALEQGEDLFKVESINEQLTLYVEFEKAQVIEVSG